MPAHLGWDPTLWHTTTDLYHTRCLPLARRHSTLPTDNRVLLVVLYRLKLSDPMSTNTPEMLRSSGPESPFSTPSKLVPTRLHYTIVGYPRSPHPDGPSFDLNPSRGDDTSHFTRNQEP